MIFKGVSETPPLNTQHNYTEEDFIYDVSLSLAIISAEIIAQSFGKCERIYRYCVHLSCCVLESLFLTTNSSFEDDRASLKKNF